MSRRASDRLKIIFGSAILWLALSHVLTAFTDAVATTGTDFIFAAFGALCGVLANMEESNAPAAPVMRDIELQGTGLTPAPHYFGAWHGVVVPPQYGGTLEQQGKP